MTWSRHAHALSRSPQQIALQRLERRYIDAPPDTTFRPRSYERCVGCGHQADVIVMWRATPRNVVLAVCENHHEWAWRRRDEHHNAQAVTP